MEGFQCQRDPWSNQWLVKERSCLVLSCLGAFTFVSDFCICGLVGQITLAGTKKHD